MLVMGLLNGANVFCFLSSFPLLPPTTAAVFGSYLSSLYCMCIASAGLPIYKYIIGEVSQQNEDEDLLILNPLWDWEQHIKSFIYPPCALCKDKETTNRLCVF